MVAPSSFRFVGPSAQQINSNPIQKDPRIKVVALENLPEKNASQFSMEKWGLTIVFTGDTHSYLDPSISFLRPEPLGGIVRRIKCIQQIRFGSSYPVIVADAGDFLEGTPYFEEFEGKPEVEFKNLAGYDVLTIGNHDFAKGWPHLQELLKQGKFQSICANILFDQDGKSFIPPYVIFEIEGRHVAFVGVMGLGAWQSISLEHRNKLGIEDPIKTLDRFLPPIRNRVDLIILLSHSGIAEDRVLAKHPLVDAVIGGHSHTFMLKEELINTPTKKTPVFHSFRNGALVGIMNIFSENGQKSMEGRIEFLDSRFDTSEKSEPSFVLPALELLKKYQALLEMYKTPFGECVEPVASKDKTLRLIPLGEAIAEVLREISSADIGMIPSGAIKIGIEKGPFTKEALHNLLAHKEPLATLKIKGSLLFSLMVSGHERWGKERSFQYSGIHLKIENSKVVGAQVRGVELDLNAFYTLAGPPFFFEREFMDINRKILPQFDGQIGEMAQITYDLRMDFAARIAKKGFGPWVKTIL